MSENLFVRRRTVLVGVLALGFLGEHAFRELPRRLEPEPSTSFALVEAYLPGVAAAELEKIVTERIESELLGLPEVEGCRSETRDGAVAVVVDRDAGTGGDWSDVRARVDRLRESMATEIVGLDGPNLRVPAPDRPEAIVAVIAADGATGPPVVAATGLAERLERTDGVRRVDLIGRPSERIVLEYDDRELAGTGMSPMKLRDYLRAQNVTAAGAYLETTERIAPIGTEARLLSFEALAHLAVRDPADGDPVSLTRLFDVRREPFRPTREEVRANGRAAVVISVYRAERFDQVAFARGVEDVVSAAGGDDGAAVEVIVFQPAVVASEVARFRSNVTQTFVVILVLLVLALGIRGGLAVAAVVPLVVLTSIIVLYHGGFALDVVLLSSLILVLGLLVDNHVVVAERIQRLRESGLTHDEAVARATRDLFGPLLAASATTVFGFLPIVLTDDPIGSYVSALFWIVLVTLSVSLVFCFLVTPVLVKQRDVPTRERPGPSERLYRRALHVLFPLWAPLTAVVVLTCFFGFRFLESADQVFFPASSRPLWSLEIEYPAGTALERTSGAARRLETLLDEQHLDGRGAVAGHVTFLGRTCPPFQASVPMRRFAPHYAQVLIEVDPARGERALERRLRAWIEEEGANAEARLRLRPIRLGGEFEWPIQVEIVGPDERLHEAAAAAALALESRDAIHVSTDWGTPIRKVKVVPNREGLAGRDLTAADLTAAMHAALFGIPLFDVVEHDARVPVFLAARATRDDELETLRDAYVYPQKGDAALLYEVASIVETTAHPLRARRDGVPCITVRGETLDPDRALAVEARIDRDLDALRATYPDHRITVAGLSSAARRANDAILDEVPWAFLLVLLALILQSKSLVETFLILLTIPLSFTGVAYGLRATGEPFSFMTLVGMTALAGLVVNNAIVLLSSIRRRLDQDGAYSRDAVIETASHRLRPIVLTTLCALTSMVVLYHSGGAMWRPLASAVISGLVFSTLLVLFVLPVLYAACLRISMRPGPPDRS